MIKWNRNLFTSWIKILRMTSTLQELCYQRLASTMMNAPPGLQEIIIGETKKRMEARVREELLTKELGHNSYTFADIVPPIMESLIQLIVTPGAIRPNYVEMFPGLSPCIVQCAVRTAEEAVRRMEERYVHKAFIIKNEEDDSIYM